MQHQQQNSDENSDDVHSRARQQLKDAFSGTYPPWARLLMMSYATNDDMRGVLTLEIKDMFRCCLFDVKDITLSIFKNVNNSFQHWKFCVGHGKHEMLVLCFAPTHMAGRSGGILTVNNGEHFVLDQTQAFILQVEIGAYKAMLDILTDTVSASRLQLRSDEPSPRPSTTFTTETSARPQLSPLFAADHALKEKATVNTATAVPPNSNITTNMSRTFGDPQPKPQVVESLQQHSTSYQQSNSQQLFNGIVIVPHVPRPGSRDNSTLKFNHQTALEYLNYLRTVIPLASKPLIKPSGMTSLSSGYPSWVCAYNPSAMRDDAKSFVFQVSALNRKKAQYLVYEAILCLRYGYPHFPPEVEVKRLD